MNYIEALAYQVVKTLVFGVIVDYWRGAVGL